MKALVMMDAYALVLEVKFKNENEHKVCFLPLMSDNAYLLHIHLDET